MTSPSSLTARERQAQGARWDLTAAHASHGIEDAEKVRQLLESSYETATSKSIADLEQELVTCYFDQPVQCHAHRPPLVFYSASVALAAVGADLQRARRQVYAPSPTFDFIPRLLCGPNGQPSALSWDAYQEPESLMRGCRGGAVLVVSPNNPDGRRLEARQAEALAEAAERHDVALVIDRAFNLDQAGQADMYEALDARTGHYYVIEDTGKSVAASGMKVAFVTAGHRCIESLSEAADDLLLNVSPFVLALITALIRSGDRTRLEAIVRANRELLHRDLLDQVAMKDRSAGSPVAWLELPHGIDSLEFVEANERAGVIILPGDQFFWAGAPDSHYVRVALARGASYFENAVGTMLEVCSALRMVK